MAYLDIWRQQLKHDLATFAPLAKEDRSLNLIYGITAAAVLWGVRDAPFNDEQKSALKEACGDEKHLPSLLRAVGGWDAVTPLDAVRSLSKRQRDSDELREALTALIGTFIEELFEQNMVQRQQIDVSGTITGGNVVIGGYQIVAGDLIIHYLSPKGERSCPTPEDFDESKFAGREARLREIIENIKKGQDTAITAVHGLGGIGKTTMAKALAARLFADKFFNAVLWADVTRNPNAVNILSSWVISYADSAFDIKKFEGNEGQIADATRTQLNSVIAEKCSECTPPRVLVVLDDVWDNGVDTARLIKRACPTHATILITTRSKNVAENLEATDESLEYFTPDESVEFLKIYLPNINAPENMLQDLGRTLGGHALALKLAARRIRKENRTNETDSEKFERLLAEYQRGIPVGSPFAELKLEQGESREDNLTISLMLSYDELDNHESKCFRALGMLAYDLPFDENILAALWDLPPETVYDIANRFQLLSLMENGYRQHGLLRAHARALLNKIGETDVFFDRYLDYIVKQMALSKDTSQFITLLPHVDYISNELINQSDASDKIERIEQKAKRHLSFAEYYWSIRAYKNATIHYRKGLQIYPQIDIQKRNEILLQLGLCYTNMLDYDNALKVYMEALLYLRRSNDVSQESSCWARIGYLYSQMVYFDQAVQYYEFAVELSKTHNQKEQEGIQLGGLGFLHYRLGNLELAEKYHNQALVILKDLGETKTRYRYECVRLIDLGNVYIAMGKYAEGINYYEQAEDLAKRKNQVGSRVKSLNRKALANLYTGQTERAEKLLEEARVLLGEQATRDDLVLTMLDAQIKLSLGDYKSASAIINLVISHQELREIDEAYLIYAIALLNNGENNRAKDAFAKSLNQTNIYINQSPRYVYANYIKGCALAGQLLLQSVDKTMVLDAFEHAITICSAKGFRDFAIKYLDFMNPVDQKEMLRDIKNLLQAKAN